MFAVVGGALVPAVGDGLVALVDGAGAVVCSGVLVAPDAVVTAGHCAGAAGAALAGGSGAARAAVRAAAIHPDPAVDLAWLALDADLPARVRPLSPLLPEAGETVSIAGFGATADGADDAGALRTAALEVVDADPGALLLFAPGANACSGDSGGPVTVERPDGEHLAAVVVAVDPACLGGRTVALPLARGRAWLDAELGPLGWGPRSAAPPAPDPTGCGGGGAALGLLLALPARRKCRTPPRAVGRR